MDRYELESVGCKTFSYPSLILIDEKGKELGLKDETIKKAKDMAVEYLKKTYHRPRYSSITYLLSSFVYISSRLGGENDNGSEDDDIAYKKKIRDVFEISGPTFNKWNKDILDTLGIKIPDNAEKVDVGNGNKMIMTLLSKSSVIENIPKKDLEAYHKYDVAFHHAIPDLLEMIKNKKEIVVRISDIVKELGSDFENKSKVDIYMGMRHILFKYDVRVIYYTFDNDMSERDRIGLKMRMLEEGDPLPSSIKKKMKL